MQHNPSIVERVFDFNKQVVGVDVPCIHPLSLEEAGWLSSALKEEADELTDASWTRTPSDVQEAVVDQVDACLDAAIFGIGGLARIGLTREQAEACFHAIMDANFEKKAGVKPGREGAKDAVKPEGWIGPEARIKEILYGQR